MLSFPVTYNRARRNSADLFPELQDREVTGAEAILFDRSFYLHFTDGRSLLFKMHGNRSNVLLLQQGKVAQLFNNHLKGDRNLVPDSLAGRLPDAETFALHQNKPAAAVPSLGPLAQQWLFMNGYNDEPTGGKWDMVQRLLKALEEPRYYIIDFEGRKRLSLVPVAPAEQVFTDPVAALNAFASVSNRVNYLDLEKAAALRIIARRSEQTDRYLQKTEQKLHELEQEVPLSQMADVLMANLHVVVPGSESITLHNFYSGAEVSIKLKPGQSPQKTAEELYRKQRNRKQELENLYSNLEGKAIFREELAAAALTVSDMTDLKALRAFLKLKQMLRESAEEEEVLPYKPVEFMGYEIRIGKNAKSNDELIKNFAHKEDLWLHARDAAGSHVIIRHHAGKTVPDVVIEYAASLAAKNSKRKNESLCPVIVTPRKHIRKLKGGPAGAVIVEKEKVLMVRPAAG